MKFCILSRTQVFFFGSEPGRALGIAGLFFGLGYYL